MNQRELNRAVARVTGESVGTVRRLGFILWESDDCSHVEREQETETEPMSLLLEEHACEPSCA